MRSVRAEGAPWADDMAHPLLMDSLVAAVHDARVFDDSKTVLDMSLKESAPELARRFFAEFARADGRTQGPSEGAEESRETRGAAEGQGGGTRAEPERGSAAFRGGTPSEHTCTPSREALASFLRAQCLPAGEDLEPLDDAAAAALFPPRLPEDFEARLRTGACELDLGGTGRDEIVAYARSLHETWRKLLRRGSKREQANETTRDALGASCLGDDDASGPRQPRHPLERFPPSPSLPGAGTERDARTRFPSSTLIPLPHPYVIPGARFRECYYWDSRFSALGLLASGAPWVVDGMLRNFGALVQRHGYVPNGNRTYYLNRSQPPLLSRMLRDIWEWAEENDQGGAAARREPRAGPAPATARRGAPPPYAPSDARALVRELFPALLAEHAYWTSGDKAVRVVVDVPREEGPGGASADAAGAWAPDVEATGRSAGPERRRRGGSAARPEAAVGPRAFVLSRYCAAWRSPRPESAREDRETARHVPEARRAALYRDLASAAESGWDFSSRWVWPEEEEEEAGGDLDDLGCLGGSRAPGTLGEIARSGSPSSVPPPPSSPPLVSRTSTTSVLPVDLNAFLFGLESDIALLARVVVEDDAIAARFEALAAQRAEAIATIFWDDRTAQWRDRWFRNADGDDDHDDDASVGRNDAERTRSGAERLIVLFSETRLRPGSFASNFAPLWVARCAPRAHRARALASLAASPLLRPGGVATSGRVSGEQWDAPNVWPPLQCILVEACRGVTGFRGKMERKHASQRGKRADNEASSSDAFPKDAPKGPAIHPPAVPAPSPPPFLGPPPPAAPLDEGLAREIAGAFLRGALTCHREHGVMFEKLHAERAGRPGGGGEYEVVEGFGWTNGVALFFLHEFFGANEEEKKEGPVAP